MPVAQGSTACRSYMNSARVLYLLLPLGMSWITKQQTDGKCTSQEEVIEKSYYGYVF